MEEDDLEEVLGRSRKAASTDEGTVLDSVFVDGDGDADPDCGFELDDAQAGEVRHVFLATLPQYLEPVQQMVKKLADPDDDEAATIRALDKVLESIQAAAVRVEVEDVRIALEHMRNTVSELLVAADEDRPDLLERILAGSRRIHVIAGGDVASESESESKSPTIFSALSGVEGFEKSVVERLTAAGLLTLDQLEIARPDEIVAVSGLDAAVVGRLLAALGISRVSRSGRPVYNEPEDSLEALIHSSVAGARPSGTEPALQSEPVEDPLEAVMQSLEGGDPPAGDAVLPEDSPLGRAIRAQVDGEASVDAVRVEVQRLRAGAAALRTAVESAIVERESLNETLAQSQERLNQMLVTLAEARAVCEERRDVLGEAEVAAERAHQSIRNMRRERLVLLDAESELAATVAELRKKVNHLLRFADPDGEVEPTG